MRTRAPSPAQLRFKPEKNRPMEERGMPENEADAAIADGPPIAGRRREREDARSPASKFHQR